jgi:hypothetical protein
MPNDKVVVLGEVKKVKSVGENKPGKDTVLERLTQVIQEIESGKESFSSCVLIMVSHNGDDHIGDEFDMMMYGAGVRPLEAAMICDIAKDNYKNMLFT